MKRLGFVNISAILIVFLALSPVFATSGDQTVFTEDALGNNDDAMSCPPTKVDTFTICLGDTIYDTLAFYFQDFSDTAIDLKLEDGPGFLEVEKSDSLYGYYSFVPPEEGEYTALFLRIGYDFDSTLIKYVYVVFLDQPPVISCPEVQSFFACEPGVFCFTIDASDPEQGPLTFNVLSGNATIEGKTVCVTGGDEPADFYVTIEVVDECGNTDVCTVRVMIEVNHQPYVTLPDDFSVFLCMPETLCFAATADDIDFDIDSVWTNFGFYRESNNKFYFYPDTSGVYTLIMTAVDTCGATGSDTMNVTVTLNEPPVVDLGDDFSIYVCGYTMICIDSVVRDDNIKTVYTNLGNYDTLTNQLCFTPDGAGVYTIELLAIDICDEYDIDTVVITVVGGEAPYVNLGEDFDTVLCEPAEICVDVQTIEIYKSITTNLGVYDELDREVCFVPDTSGTYTLIVEVTDSCDLSAADTVNITVALNNPPVVSGMRDTALYLCYPQEICLDVNVFDPDDDIDSVWVNYNGQYKEEDGIACFVPYDSGRYELIVTVRDSCGRVGADTAIVFVETDQGISLECPGDTTIFTCQLVDTFCFPIVVHGVHDSIEVEVSGINTWYNPLTDSTGEVCFWSECGNMNHITVNVNTPCNTYSCDFNVTVVCNSDPLVILPPDTTIPLCETADICIPVGISDVDGNLDSVDVTEGYYYNPATNRVCFTPEVESTYVFRVTAIDDCGAVDWDEIAVAVVLNSPPIVEFGNDTIVVQCELSEICIPFSISDTDGNVIDIIVDINGTPGIINDSQICFIPDDTGLYYIELIVVDACDLVDTAEIYVTVEAGDSVQIDCPLDPIDISLCYPGEVCWPLDITGDYYQVLTSDGSAWQDDTLCFFADTSGFYNIEVIAIAECNVDTCYIAFNVTTADSLYISCPSDTDVVLCQPDTLCRPYTVSSNVDSVTVTAPAYISGQEVCVPLLQTNDYLITMIAYGECGIDTCMFTVTARFNSPPVVDAGNDTTIVQCELSEICIPFTVSDPDTNVIDTMVDINGVSGVIIGNQVCFTPGDFDTYRVIIAAFDECNASDSDTVFVTVESGGSATIFPIADQADTVCGADTLCVVPLFTPDDSRIIVSPPAYYDTLTGEICIEVVDEGGAFDITVIAEASCGSDTIEFTWNIELAQPPAISCPNFIDDTLCLVEPVTYCYPVTVTGAVSQIEVNPIGYFSDSQVCIPVDTAGIYEIEIVATGICGTDACTTMIEIREDLPPELFLPDYQVFERCFDDTDMICIDGIYATDVESAVSLTMTCGVGVFTLITSDSGEVCFLPDTFGVYEFCFKACDNCDSTLGSFFVEIREREDCDVCMRLSIDGGECTPVGLRQGVDLRIETYTQMGGFNLLVSYDASVMAFWSATITGTQIDGWEYFSYRAGSADCGESCPSGLMRFVGLADMNDGAHHPPDSTLMPNGVLIATQFQVANDQNLGGFFLPIGFVWFSCGDNAISDPTGNDLYVDLRIYNVEGGLIWDEMDDVTYPESDRIFGIGAPDTCIVGGGIDKPAPIRCIEFINGGICVIPAESIDVRGDINLNGVAYEIADAVVFTNFFIYGFSAFNINVDGQIAATDVNADGLTLTVGDLVYLIRVIIGDADPIPRVTPYPEELTVSTNHGDGVISVATEAVSTIGAALFVYDISGDFILDEPRLAEDAVGMDLMFAMENGELRMLIYNFGTNMIPSGINNLIEIPYRGEGQLNLTQVEIVDYQGRPYTIANKQSGVPNGFALNQNYPTPFDRTTTISFTLPSSTEWKLEIFNITGGLVREYQGTSETGDIVIEWDGRTDNGSPTASGVYLYRLQTANFSATKKMVLLK